MSELTSFFGIREILDQNLRKFIVYLRKLKLYLRFSWFYLRKIRVYLRKSKFYLRTNPYYNFSGFLKGWYTTITLPGQKV